MGRLKDLMIQVEEEYAQSLIERGMSPEAAYIEAADKAYSLTTDRLADMADFLRQRRKDEQ